MKRLILGTMIALFVPVMVIGVVSTNDPWMIMAEAAIGSSTAAPTIDKSTVFTFSKSLLAFVAAGGIPDEQLKQSFIDAHYINNQIGNPAYVNDDFWGVLALRSTGILADDPVIRDARAFIERTQRDTGGWSWGVAPSISADLDDTAAAIMALLETGASQSDDNVVRAIDFFRAHQKDDGGFPNMPSDPQSNVASTAWVVSTLWKAGENPRTWTKGTNNPITYLESQPNSHDIPAVMIALAGKSYPVRSYVPPVVVPQQKIEEQKIVRPVESQVVKPAKKKAVKKIVKKKVTRKK